MALSIAAAHWARVTHRIFQPAAGRERKLDNAKHLHPDRDHCQKQSNGGESYGLLDDGAKHVLFSLNGNRT